MIRARRRELRLSERQAATRAGVARNTWAAAEEGARQPAERSVAGIEVALRWATGSVDQILAGGKPTPQEDQPEAAPPPSLPAGFDLDAEITRAAHLDVSPQTRLTIIRRLIDLYEEAQAERQAAAEQRPITHGDQQAG